MSKKLKATFDPTKKFYEIYLSVDYEKKKFIMEVASESDTSYSTVQIPEWLEVRLFDLCKKCYLEGRESLRKELRILMGNK